MPLNSVSNSKQANSASSRGQKTYGLNKNKYLLDPEWERLEHIIESYIDRDTRDCSLLRLALRTGARATELLNITHQDLSEYEATVLIKGIKNSNDRELPVDPKLFTYLLRVKQDYAQYGANKQLSGGNKKLFPISYPRLVQIWLHYRPVHKKFHSLRHTFAIRLYKKTKDIRLLQMALGHRNIANTMIYADYVYSQTELKKLLL